MNDQIILIIIVVFLLCCIIYNMSINNNETSLTPIPTTRSTNNPGTPPTILSIPFNKTIVIPYTGENIYVSVGTLTMGSKPVKITLTNSNKVSNLFARNVLTYNKIPDDTRNSTTSIDIPIDTTSNTVIFDPKSPYFPTGTQVEFQLKNANDAKNSATLTIDAMESTDS